MKIKEIDLKPCPFCGFSKEDFKKLKLNSVLSSPKWEDFAPKLAYEYLLGSWIVVCENCGVMVIFNSKDGKEVANQWNERLKNKRSKV